MTKKITFISFILLFIFILKPCFSMTDEELRQYVYVDFYDLVSSYNVRNINIVEGAYNEKKISVGNSGFTTYLEKTKKYITFLEYRGASRRIDTYQKPFLLDWFKIANNAREFTLDDSAESILADENFGLFFTSTMYSTRGKTYFITTQKAVNDSMEKNLKLGEKIKVYMLNLGQFSNNIPVFIITGYEKAPTISQAVQDEIYFRQYFPVLKEDIFNRRYDKAKGNIEMLLKKYPNNIDLRLNLCLIFNQTNFFDKSISCYKDVLKIDPKNYDAYYGISTAYYNSASSNQKSTATLIIENTTKAIDIIESLTAKPIGSLAMIKFNCYYLRAMAKITLNDKSAINDLEEVNKNHPTLVSSQAIDLFKEQMGVR